MPARVMHGKVVQLLRGEPIEVVFGHPAPDYAILGA
jgi:hypothetical protein